MRIIIEGHPGEGKSAVAAKVSVFLRLLGLVVTVKDDDQPQSPEDIDRINKAVQSLTRAGPIHIETRNVGYRA